MGLIRFKAQKKRRYSPKAQKYIGSRMRTFHKGGMYGGKGRTYQVTEPKQAKAIALSEARQKGMKVPSKE